MAKNKMAPTATNVPTKGVASPKPPKPADRPPRARPAKVEITVDRALKNAWDSSLASLRAAKREGAGAFDELWETVGRILEHDPPLYLAGGFATAAQFLKEHLGENERTAQRMVRVARYASPAEEAKYGVSKLDAALTYIESATGGPSKGRVPVDFEKLRLDVKRGDKAARVSLAEASVDEVRAAARELRAKTAGPRSNEPPAAAALRTALRSAGVDGIKVQVVRETVSISAIPLRALASLGRALTKVKLPEAAAKAKPAGSAGVASKGTKTSAKAR